MLKKFFISFCFLTVLFSVVGFSQATQEDIIKTANKHFENKEYVQAAKLFSQLVSTNAQNPEFNYKYGACLLFTSDKKEDALKYLKFAVDKYKEVNEAYFYLARAYHVSYRFDEAIALYNKFKTSVKPKDLKKYDLDLLIAQCESGKQLLDEMQQVKVISQKKMMAGDFFRGYNLGKMDRKILVKTEEFQTKEDATAKEPLLIVHGPTQENLYFSAYKYGTEFARLDKDIFWSAKLPDGTWSEFKSLGPFINTDQDEDYPYLHPNGKTLYFASKGHGGLGGYDIYKSELDTVTDLWGKPQNLGFTINSPFDDYLYIVDQEENAAFFASNRSNKGGETTVYKIIPPKKRDNFVIVKGEVKVEGGKSNVAKLLVKRTIGGEIVGNFATQGKTGNFLFSLGELETYDVEVTFSDSLKHTVQITTPAKNREKIIYKDIIIKTTPTITASVEDKPNVQTREDELLAFYEQLARLEKNQVKDIAFSPNAPKKGKVRKPAGNKPAATSAPVATTTPAAPAAATNPVTTAPETPAEPELSPKENALRELDLVKAEKREVQAKVNAAYNLAEQRNQKTNILKSEVDALVAKEQQASEPAQKAALLKEIEEKKTELQQSQDDAELALNIAKKQEENLVLKQKEEQLAQSYLDAMELASKPGSASDAVKKLEQYQSEMAVLEEQIKAAPKEENMDELKKQVADKKTEKQTLEKKLTKAESDLSLIKSEKNTLVSQLAETKKKALKEEINLQIKEQEAEIAKQEAALEVLQNNMLKVNSEMEELGSQLTLLTEIETESEKPNLAAKTNEDKNRISSTTTVNKAVVPSSEKKPTEPITSATSTTKPSNTTNSTAGNTNKQGANTNVPASNNNVPATNNTVGNNTIANNNTPKNTAIAPEELSTNNASSAKPNETSSGATAKNSGTTIINSPTNDVGEQPVATVNTPSSTTTAPSATATAPLATTTAAATTTNTPAVNATKPAQGTVSNVNAKGPGTSTAKTQSLMATDINAASPEKIAELSKSILGINSTDPLDNRGGKGAAKVEQASSALKEALLTQQKIENKKQEVKANPQNKAALEQELEFLEVDLQMAQNKYINSMKEANVMEYKSNAEKVDMELFIDPKLENSQVSQLKTEIDNLWSQSEQAQNKLPEAKTNEQKGAIYNEMLSAQVQAIKKQDQLENLIEERKKVVATETTTPVSTVAIAPTTTLNTNTNTNANSNTKINTSVSEPITSAPASETQTSNITSAKTNGGNVATKQPESSNNTEVKNSTAPIANTPAIATTVNSTPKTTTNNTNVAAATQPSTNVAQNTTPNSNQLPKKEATQTTTTSNVTNQEYAKKATELKKQADQTVDPFQKQELYEQAKLNEMAAQPSKFNELKTDINNNKQTFKEANVALLDAKGKMNKNASSAEAADLEKRAYDLMEKANSKLKEAENLTDAVEKAKKESEAKETINYALAKQEQAIKKYQESAQFPADPNLANYPPATSAENYKDDFVLPMEGELTAPAGVIATGGKTNNNNTTVATTNPTPSPKTTTTVAPKPAGAKPTAGGNDYMAAYEKLIKEANQIESAEARRLDKVMDLRAQAKTNRDKSEKLLLQVQGNNNEQEVAAKINEANKFRQLAEKAEAEANSEEYFMNNSLAEAKAKRNEAALILKAMEDNQVDFATKMDDKKALNKINKYLEQNVVATTTTVSEGIELSATKKYDANTQIPIDVQLPEGLVYKVQVGAFRKKIDPSIFSGISPLTGEQTGTGITRYTAGFFRSFKAADMAKGRIRNLGYKDAFVVVFYNGKRITPNEAETIVENKNAAEKSEYQAVTAKEVSQLKQAGIKEEEAYTPVAVAPINVGPKVKENVDVTPAKAESINNLEGIYFTVQIGVYRNPKTQAELFNITPLQTFTTDNGLMRYSTGVYRDLNQAEQRKTEVINIGVIDAYVVAYKNGVRITVEEAIGLPPKANQVNVPAVNKGTNKGAIAKQTDNTTQEKAIFKVQLGAYKGEVDIDKNPFLSQLKTYGLQFYISPNGLYLYTAGEYTNKAKADELRNIVVDLGIKDAFVIAFNSEGKRISVKEALELLKN